MISKLTTLAANYQEGGLAFPLSASTDYLFNTKNIKDLKAYDTNDSEFLYVFEPEDRRASYAIIRVDDTKTEINTKQAIDAADGSLASICIDLDVYEDDDFTSTPVAHTFNKDDFCFGSAYSTTVSEVWFNIGGFEKRRYFVLHTLAEIVTLAEATS